MSHRNAERNDAMWEDKKIMSWPQLCMKYRVALSTAKEIILNETVRRLKEADRKGKKISV